MGFQKGQNPNHPKKGASIKVDPIRDPQDIQRIKNLLIDQNNMRDFCLFTLGVNTAWRANELVKLKVGDVDGLREGDFLELKQSKNKKYRATPLNRSAIRAIEFWLAVCTPANAGLPLFPSRQGQGALTVPTVCNMVKHWCSRTGASGRFGSHSLRKTWGYQQRVVFQSPLPLLVEAYGHSSERQTLDYLGIQASEITALYRNEI